MRHFIKKLTGIIFPAALALFVLLGTTAAAAAGFSFPLDSDGKLIVVIDPGHGGDNDGAITDSYVEKEITMQVALAMKDELEKYDDITVYLTHEDVNKSMTIKQRCEYAKKVNADYLFCLHFNMSTEHELYGSEVWISNRGACNREGYRFGYILMETFEELGLFDRGIKTRNQSDGDNYYGINRYSTDFGIPSALIEHAHLDHARDQEFVDEESDFEALGRADATAAAKYFGLSSTELGVDYSAENFAPEVEKGIVYCKEDTTAPDYCEISPVSADYENMKIAITASAADGESAILYYAVSLDAGRTYGEFCDWTGTDVLVGECPETIDIPIEIPDKTTPQVKLMVINQYGYRTESNVLTDYGEFALPEPEPEPELLPDEAADDMVKDKSPGLLAEADTTQKIAVAVLGVCCLILITVLTMSLMGKKKR